MRKAAYGIIILLIFGCIWLSAKALGIGAPQISYGAKAVYSLLAESKAEKEYSSPKTILVLGRAGGENSAPYLTDTLALLNIDRESGRASIVSLPRDLLVKLPETQGIAKINAYFPLTAGEDYKNLDPIKKKVEEISGVHVDNAVVFDLETLEEVIEKVGGVTVYVPEDIYDPSFPAPRGEYKIFSLESGWRYLNAESALDFARTRHSREGDFDRIRRQQELLRALKGKISSLNPVWDSTKLASLYTLVGRRVTSDLSLEDIESLWQIGSGVPLDSIRTFVIDMEGGLVEPRTIQLPSGPSAALVGTKEDPFDYSEIQTAIRDFLNE